MNFRFDLDCRRAEQRHFPPTLLGSGARSGLEPALIAFAQKLAGMAKPGGGA